MPEVRGLCTTFGASEARVEGRTDHVPHPPSGGVGSIEVDLSKVLIVREGRSCVRLSHRLEPSIVIWDSQKDGVIAPSLVGPYVGQGLFGVSLRTEAVGRWGIPSVPNVRPGRTVVGKKVAIGDFVTLAGVLLTLLVRNNLLNGGCYLSPVPI